MTNMCRGTLHPAPEGRCSVTTPLYRGSQQPLLRCLTFFLFFMLVTDQLLSRCLTSSIFVTAADATAAMPIDCPLGWALYAPATSSPSTRQCTRVVTATSSSVDATCADVFNRDMPYSQGGTTPWPYRDTIVPHAAAVRSSDYNDFLWHLFYPTLTGGDAAAGIGSTRLLLLGGVAGYGTVEWNGNAEEEEEVDVAMSSSAVPPFTYFDSAVDWHLHSGIIAMQSNKSWTLVSDRSVLGSSIACSFVAMVRTPVASSSGGDSSSNSNSSSSSSSDEEVAQRRASRPAVPQPAPACMEGWTSLPETIDMADGAPNTLCYRLYAAASEIGGRYGQTFTNAVAECTAAHPKGSLAAVMSAEENAWITSTFIATATFNDTANDPVGNAVVVFLGSTYMRETSGELIGNWYADQYLYTSAEYALSSPSSPAWPTTANHYYANWAAGEPTLSHGAVGMVTRQGSVTSSAMGTWVGVDPRSTQPFLCSYRNDGSIFPTTTPAPPTTSAPDTSPGPSVYCPAGWFYLGVTNSCYHAYPLAGVTPATFEATCQNALQGVVAAAKATAVHAVAVFSVEESRFVGAILELYLRDRYGSSSAFSGILVALIGTSFIDYGQSGFYINGALALNSTLADELWAAQEPSQEKGCVTVDVEGNWYYTPCTSSSMPSNTATTTEAYVCQYDAAAISPSEVIPVPPTTQPPDSDSSSSDSGSDGGTETPLAERVATLSNATHLVVSAGTTGIYTVDGPNATDKGINGLHLYFAPVSDYYTYQAPTHTTGGAVLTAMAVTPTSLDELLYTTNHSEASSQSSTFSPCDGFKEQHRIFRVKERRVTVAHVNTSEVGYICVSQDGRDYVGTSLTYEVVDLSLAGLLPITPQTSAADGQVSVTTPWVPPLFYGPTEVQANLSLVHLSLGVDEHASGTIQLVLQRGSDDVTTDSPYHITRVADDPAITHIRFSSSASCDSSADFRLLSTDIEVQSFGVDAYTRPFLGTSATSPVAHSPLLYSAFSYQDAVVQPGHLGSLERLYDLERINGTTQLRQQPPSEYFVCIAVQKGATSNATADSAVASERLLAIWSAGNTTESGSNAAASVAARRLRSTVSLDAEGKDVRLFTAVPGLKVYLVPPPLVVKGLWALSPQGETESTRDADSPPRGGSVTASTPLSKAFLTPVAASFRRGAHFKLHHGDIVDGVSSSSHLHVSQFSSPIILLDGRDLRPGMAALLTQNASSCNRYQATPRDDPTSSSWMPSSLDTMLPVSTVPMTVVGAEGQSTTTTMMSYIQLNLNHTGLWGHHPTAKDNASQQQTWYVCMAYDALSPFIPLQQPEPLRITVHRLEVTRITVDASPLMVSNAADVVTLNTTHLNLNVGFAGLVWLEGVASSTWSTATLQSSLIHFEAPLPSSGTADDTAAQCANPELFYMQRGLRLLASDPASIPRTGILIPLGYLKKNSPRRLQLCLSIPLPFTPLASDRRAVAVPLVSVTVDIQPTQLMFIGQYSSVPSTSSTEGTATVIRLAEGTQDVVLPLIGYGIRSDMSVYLSRQPCSSEAAANGISAVQQQSLLNISVVPLYDLPHAYRGGAEAVYRPQHFIALRHDEILSTEAAERLFGSRLDNSARVPLDMCLYAPGTDAVVFSTNFRLVVEPPRIVSITNIPSDVALLSASMASKEASNETGGSGVVVYGATMDLLVEGFGVNDGSTVWLIPARQCSNKSSFLWNDPVALSALPSRETTTARMAGASSASLYPASTRYENPQTSASTWFLSLTPAETTRFGASAAAVSGTYPDGFEWCVRMEYPATLTTNTTSSGSLVGDNTSTAFVSTGIAYRLVLPAVKGFSTAASETSSLQLRLPRQDAIRGYWYPIQLVGPLVDVVDDEGNPLYIFLAAENDTCKAAKESLLRVGLPALADVTFTTVRGSAVLLPQWLTTTGTYQLCASAVYPATAALDTSVESELQYLSLSPLRVEIFEPVFAVLSLNHTTAIEVEQGEQWILPITGSQLTNQTLVRLQSTRATCGKPMMDTQTEGVQLPDIDVQYLPPDLVFEAGNSNDGSIFETVANAAADTASNASPALYISLSQDLIRGLSAPATYVLCFRANRATDWEASGVTVTVQKHVRRPTHYPYFPANGTEDVVAMTALSPTKLAMPWNSGEESTVNIVGALNQPASLALWCLPGSQAVDQDDLVPCGHRRRVLFVKPLDSDGDPCFVDAEAITDDVQRGPFVLEYGVLDLPHNLSSVNATTPYPNMTQPWILCIETGPERWREPIYPIFHLQYTPPIPTGFRPTPDDSSNTTAPFPTQHRNATSVDVTVLQLHAQDSSQVVYLNGYGLQRGHLIRFGQRCDEAVPEMSLSEAASSSAAASSKTSIAHLEAVSLYQKLANPLLYTEPLPLEDDDGVFLVPRKHILYQELAATPLCYSSDGGATYQRTTLSLEVGKSQMKSDVEGDHENLLQQIIENTLLVPQNTSGRVNISAYMIKSTAATQDTAPSSISASSQSDETGITAPATQMTEVLPVGSVVLFSRSCDGNSEDLPTITVDEANVLPLSVLHTAVATTSRLLICVASRLSSSFSTSEAALSEDALTFSASGLYYYVVAVVVDQVVAQSWTPTSAMAAEGIRHVVLRRGDEEDLLLPVTLRSTTVPASHSRINDATTLEDRFLQVLEANPTSLSVFSLLRLAIAPHCPSSRAPESDAASVTPRIASYAGVGITFGASAITLSPVPAQNPTSSTTTDGTNGAAALAATLVAALPGKSSNASVPHFSFDAPGVICFSVDGGLHYYSAGIIHYTEPWAATLQVKVEDAEEEEGDDDDSATAATIFSNTTNIATYEQSNAKRHLVDPRFVVDDVNSTSAQALADLGHLTTDHLWNGFMGDDGIVMNQHILLTAPVEIPITAESAVAPRIAPLDFSLNYRQRHLPTNLTLEILPLSLSCMTRLRRTEVYLRRQDVGRLLQIADRHCSGGMANGVRIRAIPEPSIVDEATACSAASEVEASYVFDLVVMQPALWAANTTPHRAAQLPTALLYTPEGQYRLCLVLDQPSSLWVRQSTTQYTLTPVRLHITSGLTLSSAGGAAAGETVTIAQGSNVVLTVNGAAVHPNAPPVLVAFAPQQHRVLQRQAVTTQTLVDAESPQEWTWSGGCREVPLAWNPYTGSSLLVAPSSSNEAITNRSASSVALLQMPWTPVSVEDGVLHIAARYTREVALDGNASYHVVCYSVDGGLTFHAVGDVSGGVAVSVSSPSITTLSRHRHRAVEPTLADLQWANAPSVSALRVQRLYVNESADAAMPVSGVPVSQVHWQSNGPSSPPYLSRPPLFYYAWGSILMGNGIGSASGRQLPSSSAASAPDVNARTAAIPTVAAAVAVVRTSRHGASCNGDFLADLADYQTNASSDAVLAMPIILMNLRTATVWTDADTEELTAWLANHSAAEQAAFGYMNPALENATWKNQTRALLQSNTDDGGPLPINALALLGLAANAEMAASRLMGETLVVCLSTDGARFYSANAAAVARIASAEVQRQQRSCAVAATGSSSPASMYPTVPLFLRPDVSNAFLTMRDVSLTAQLLLRRTVNGSVVPSSSSSSGALNITVDAVARFQVALATAASIDPAVVSALVQPSGFVTLTGTEAADSENHTSLVATMAHHSVMVAAAEAQSDANADPVELSTYALVLTIVADVKAVDGTEGQNNITAAPEVLYRCIELLRSNESGPALLSQLVEPSTDNPLADMIAPTASTSGLLLSLATLNFTMSNGVDLHEAVASNATGVLLPTSSDEVRWRALFLALPYAAVAAEEIPGGASDESSSAAVTWWEVLLLLILPVCLIYATYHVYKKYLRKPSAEPPVVENTA